MSNKSTLIDDYFTISQQYKRSHGNGTLLFMQVGSFYEMYALDDTRTEMTEVANLLSITVTRRDGKSGRNRAVTTKNPYMSGFPEVSLVKMLKRLIENGYIVVIYNQTGETRSDSNKQVRELQGIYSPGTFISETTISDSTNLVGVWIEEMEQLSGRTLPVLGFASIDLGTGHVLVHEVHSTASEPNAAYDELVALAQKTSPREVVIRADSTDVTKTAANCFEVDAHLIHHKIGAVSRDWERVSYQNEVLERVFGKRNPSPIEDFELDRKPWALRALVMILEWAWEHVNANVKNLLDPVTVQPHRLVLGNAAIFQLNVIENSMLEGNFLRRGTRSLFDVVNFTTTVIGRRYLKRQLTTPLVSASEISARHSMIAKLLKTDALRNTIGGALTGVMDLERLHRKMVMQQLSPQEFYCLHTSYTSILDVADQVRKLLGRNNDASWLDSLIDLTAHYRRYILIDRLSQWRLNDIRQNVFAHGVSDTLDTWDAELEQHIAFMNGTISALSRASGTVFTIDSNDRDGYMIKTTQKRANDLRTTVKQSHVRVDGYHITDIDIKKVGSSVRIGFNKFTEHAEARQRIEQLIVLKMRRTWNRAMLKFYKHWETELLSIVDGIAQLDFLVSGAKCAKANNYCRPTVHDNANADADTMSSIACTELRHPIIEQLLVDNPYTPHTITLSGNGMLLYGSNASGKSSLSKAVGLACILAQSGLYVPAKSMTLVPYKFLYARITGNDNILRGQSSFGVEMLELRAILRRASPRTLCLGDEVCRGTEVTSGTSIVAAAVIRLAETKTSFIFATHLHALGHITEIKSLSNVAFYHIHSTYDEVSNKIIYERSLRPGQGDAVYGLQVATSMLGDKTFSDMAGKFVKRLTNTTELVEQRKSKWNPDVYLTACEICSDKEHLNVHHIKHRSQCTDGYSDHIKQDHRGNLVVLCRPCHEQVHAGTIAIDGWLATSTGRDLKWNRVDNTTMDTAIRKLMTTYDACDRIKSWAHADAVKRLNVLGHRSTADYVRKIWTTAAATN